MGGLPPTSNEQNIATFFSNALAAIGGTTAGPGMPPPCGQAMHEVEKGVWGWGWGHPCNIPASYSVIAAESVALFAPQSHHVAGRPSPRLPFTSLVSPLPF